jgi:hypothetical protein
LEAITVVKPKIIDNAFSEEQNEQLVRLMENVTWFFGRRPHPDAPFGFWSTTYMQRPDFFDLGITVPLHPTAKIMTDVLDAVLSKVEGKYEVLQIASNGQTYGQDGHMHHDDTRKDTYTCLVYIAREWKVEWGGETSFYLDGNPHLNVGKNVIDISSVLPLPRRAVFFESSLVHMGRAPNRVFSGLRMTLAYKLRKK